MKITELENQPQDVVSLRQQLATKEQELKKAKETGNKRQGMLQQMLAVETKLKAQMTILEIKAKRQEQSNQQPEQTSEEV